MPDPANPTDFERSDAPPGLLLGLAAGFAASVAAVLLTLALGFPSALGDIAKGPLAPLPPQPRLQAAPLLDRIAYERRETRRLESYGWADPAHRRVHVPVEGAMREVAAKGWTDGR
jgi:hypothetical protein